MQLPPTKHIDVSRWPVLIYRGPERVSDEEMADVMRESDMLRELGHTHGMIIDVRKTVGLTPAQRKIITDNMGKNVELVQRTCVGVALVFSSRVLRGILTAIFWVRPAVVTTRVFNDDAEAFAWLEEAVAARKRAA